MVGHLGLDRVQEGNEVIRTVTIILYRCDWGRLHVEHEGNIKFRKAMVERVDDGQAQAYMYIPWI